MMKKVTQEDMMGCGIACVACALNKSYKNTKKLFENPNNASTKGYYLRDLVKVLNSNGKNYFSRKINKKKFKLGGLATIVFIKRCKKYPYGHYLIKTEKGWMNPWINYPNIAPAKSGFENQLPGEAQWIVYPKD